MAARKASKERRRQERAAAREAAQRAAARKRMLQRTGGVLVGVLVVALMLVVVFGSGRTRPATSFDGIRADARVAGCDLQAEPSEGRAHTLRAVRYHANPPTSGPHNPVPARDGVYAPGAEPSTERWVHSLEHGRVIFQYRPGMPARDVTAMQALAEQPLHGVRGYHTLVMRSTDLPANYAVIAWAKALTCQGLTGSSEKAMREFRAAYTDKAPERVP